MNPTTFSGIAAFLAERSGLALGPDKTYLVESRLQPIARREGLASLEALLAAIRQRPTGDLARDVLEAMTTNETSFFRDRTPFDQIRDIVLPALVAARRQTRRLSIWCAAASTGQEPYSLAMVLKEMGPELGGCSVEIVATDLNNQVLERARRGVYSQFEVQRGVPSKLLLKYFRQVGTDWEIDPALRAMVRFRPLNLLADFSALGRFDLVLCRNVLIYFDQPTKVRVLQRMAGVTAPDGYLMLGSTESIIGLGLTLTSDRAHHAILRPGGAEAPLRVAARG